LDMKRQTAAVEQLGQNLRLQDKKYVQELQQQGNMARLSTDADFKKELARSIMGKNTELLEKQLQNRNILDVSDDEFKRSMARMDISTAWDMFKNDLATQKQRELYSGAGAVTTAGVGAYGTYSDAQQRSKEAADRRSAEVAQSAQPASQYTQDAFAERGNS
jgi:hypothetical protein